MNIKILGINDPFPPLKDADSSGLLAVGADLSPSRLILAYKSGIFPWFSEYDPILWYSLDPRFVLFPDDLIVRKSMRTYFNNNKFRVSYDTCFNDVIHACANISRRFQSGTWITEDMILAYNKLHQIGCAHSVEVWDANKLVGGLYGISIGKIFFGESMFSSVSNASKFGFISLVRKLKEENYFLIDCQQKTDHLVSLGAVGIDRKLFQEYLKRNSKFSDCFGIWKN